MIAWDALARRKLRLVSSHQKSVTSVAEGANGASVVSCSIDGQVKMLYFASELQFVPDKFNG